MEKIIENKDQALLSKKLATIDLNVPIQFDEDAMILGEPNQELLKPLIVEWEFNTLGKRLFGESFKAGRGFESEKPLKKDDAQVELDFSGNQHTAAPKKPEASEGAQLKTMADVPHQYSCILTESELDQWIDTLHQQEWFCLDTETTGLDPKTVELIGFSFCCQSGVACYLPVGGEGGLSKSVIREKLKPLLTHTKVGKIGHNLKYDLSVLLWNGYQVKGPFIDTMILHSLVRPGQKHGMDVMAEAHLGYSPVSIESLIGPKGKDQRSMKDVPMESLAEYAAEDADITWQLYQKLKPEIEPQGQHRVFHEVEMPLLPVLVSMEYEGIRLDPDSMVKFSAQLLELKTELEQEIHRMAGVEFNIASPKQLGEVLFENLKLVEKPKKTKTGQYATNENVLQTLSAEHEIVSKILEFRAVYKLRSTYAEALPQSIFDKTGRIHTTFHQAATATGRLNSQNPNLQNIPIRRELGQEIRRAFVPREEGFKLLSADYSQIELRIMASISGDPSMKAAFESGEDIHAATAAHVFNVDLVDVTKDMRRKAKTVNFGVMYGISAFGLSQRLGIPRKEAAEIIKHYFDSFPSIKDYMEKTLESARSKGYVETLTGRRRYLPEVLSANGTIRSMAERNAINAPIQGTAADMIKLAMSAIWNTMEERKLESKLVLQVHDELVFDLKQSELSIVEPLVRDLMIHALPLEVPIEVELGSGAHWLEAH